MGWLALGAFVIGAMFVLGVAVGEWLRRAYPH